MRAVIFSTLLIACCSGLVRAQDNNNKNGGGGEDIINLKFADGAQKQFIKELGQPTRGPTKITGDIDDIISGDIKFSDIDYGKSDKNVLRFSLDTFKIDDPSKMSEAEQKKLKEQWLVYSAYGSEMRRQNKGQKLILNMKAAFFFLRFQVSRMQDALGQKVNTAGGIEGSRAKVIKNAKAFGIPQSDRDEVESTDPKGGGAKGTEEKTADNKTADQTTDTTTPTTSTTPDQTQSSSNPDSSATSPAPEDASNSPSPTP